MPEGRKMENQVRLAEIDLVNARQREYNNNIQAIETVSRIGGLIIDQMLQNVIVDDGVILHIMNLALIVTKSDPEAEPGKYDRLLKVYELYADAMLLPTKYYRYRITLVIVFFKEFGASQRRHNVRRDSDDRIITKKVFSSTLFLQPRIMTSTKSEKKQKSKERKGRIHFRKRKSEANTQEIEG